MDAQEPNGIKELFQRLAPEPMAVIRGTVISASPLRIRAANDDKLVLNDGSLCVPRHLTDYIVTGTLTFGGATGIADMVVNNSLKIGDQVYMLSFNYGKKYYVLDREGPE